MRSTRKLLKLCVITLVGIPKSTPILKVPPKHPSLRVASSISRPLTGIHSETYRSKSPHLSRLNTQRCRERLLPLSRMNPRVMENRSLLKESPRLRESYSKQYQVDGESPQSKKHANPPEVSKSIVSLRRKRVLIRVNPNRIHSLVSSFSSRSCEFTVSESNRSNCSCVANIVILVEPLS